MTILEKIKFEEDWLSEVNLTKENVKIAFAGIRATALEQEDALRKAKAEILDEAEYAYADFDRYKEDILHAEPDELPDDDFRYGLERAVEIINKYKAGSENKACKDCYYNDGEVHAECVICDKVESEDAEWSQ